MEWKLNSIKHHATVLSVQERCLSNIWPRGWHPTYPPDLTIILYFWWIHLSNNNIRGHGWWWWAGRGRYISSRWIHRRWAVYICHWRIIFLNWRVMLVVLNHVIAFIWKSVNWNVRNTWIVSFRRIWNPNSRFFVINSLHVEQPVVLWFLYK